MSNVPPARLLNALLADMARFPPTHVAAPPLFTVLASVTLLGPMANTPPLPMVITPPALSAPFDQLSVPLTVRLPDPRIAQLSNISMWPLALTTLVLGDR